MTQDKLLTTRQVAKMLAVSEKTVRNWRDTNSGVPFTRVSARNIRYSRADVLKFITETKTHTVHGAKKPRRSPPASAERIKSGSLTMVEPVTRLGAWVRSNRESAAITQTSLAELLGISMSRMNRIEVTDQQPSIRVVVALADLFNADVSEIITMATEQAPRKREYSWRVINERHISRNFLQPNKGRIDAYVAENGARNQIAGIHIFEKEPKQ